MKITKLNVSQICSARVYTNAVCEYYIYKERISIISILFGRITLRDEGFYDTLAFKADKYVTVEEIEKSGEFIIKGRKVYYKPHVEFRMSNGNLHTMFFETKNDLQSFMESDIMKSVNWINV